MGTKWVGWGWRLLVLVSLCLTSWSSWQLPQAVGASQEQPSDVPLPLSIEIPEIDPQGFEATPFQLPVTPEPALTSEAPILPTGSEVSGVLFADGQAGVLHLSPGSSVTGTRLLQLPGPLPDSLERTYEIQGNFATTATLSMVLPVTQSPDLLELGTIFRYDPATEHWQRLRTRHIQQGERVGLQAEITEPGIYAAAISTQSEVGNYEQPWAPTISEAQVDLFTGGVSWSYPLDVPSGRAGQAPAVGLSYHSGAIDNLRGDLNPQASWVGWGWNLDVGYVTRKIELDENFVPRYTQDFSLVFNGVSSKLISLGNNQYRTEDERFWRIERISTPTNRGGDYWLITTMDGTQYRFGYQDETAGVDSRESAWWMVGSRCDGSEALCTENWRWNLDQISDPRGNHIRLDYRVERSDFCFSWEGVAYCYCGRQNSFCASQHRVVSEGYVRGGSLEQITYSWPQAAYKLYFEVEERDDYPHSRDRGTQWVQTFWIKERLKAIVVLSNGQGEVMRRYELQRDPTDDRLLQSIQPVAADGSRLPRTMFHYLGLAGYLEGCQEGRAEGGWKPWLSGIENGYGSGISLNYTAPENLPWFQNGQIRGPLEEGQCWYRYRVREMVAYPGVGPAVRTVYEYRQADGEAPHDGSWEGDEFRGHPRVRVRQRRAEGSLGAYSDTWFLQGQAGPARAICGEELTDRDGLEGRSYRQVAYDAAGNGLVQQTQRWNYVDLGGGRHFVGLAAACSFPNGGIGTYSRVDYAYDGYGQVVREQRYGDVARTGDEVTMVTRYTYNEAAWILTAVAETQVIAVDGTVELQSRMAYDEQPFGAPPTRGLATWTAQGTERGGWITGTVAYDEWGNVTSATDALGRTTRTVYDDRFHLYPTTVTNPLGQTGGWSWDQRLSVILTVTDTNQAVRQIQHDAFGRGTAVIPSGQSVPAVKYSYPAGEVVAAPFAVQAAARIDPYTTPDYRRSWTIYDGLGRVIQTQTEVENGWLAVKSTAYNELGQAVLVSAPYTVPVAGGTYLPPNWNVLQQTRTEYDALGRPVKVTAPGNLVVQKAYRDWSELTLDANGHQRRSVQNGLGRLIEVHTYTGQYAAPDWNAGTRIVMRYEYDAQSHLTGVQDANGNVTRIYYDPWGRKTSLEDPSMGRWSYRYDAAGNLISQTDAEGNTLRFVYDSLNRLVRKQAGAVVLATYEYDQGPNGIGRRTAMTDNLGTARWTYDIEGRLVNGSRTVGGENFTTQLSYGAAGQVTSQVLPTGEALRWIYNRRGLVQQLRSLTYGQDYLRQASYNAQGQPVVQVWGNNLATTYSYAADTQRLQQLQVSGGLLDLRYSYDPSGNITAIQDGANGGQLQTFRYDPLDRLSSAQTNSVGEGQYQESYQYDWMGNILTKTVGGVSQRYTYGQDLPPMTVTVPETMTYRTYFPIALKERCGGTIPCQATLTQPFAAVATTGGFRAVYDRNGNMVVRVVVENGQPVTYMLSYNAENQIESMTNTTTLSVTRYLYDGDGARIEEIREGPGGVTTILRLGEVEIEQQGAERITKTYYSIGGQRIALREGGNVTYFQGDQLGSASLATRSDGSLIGRQLYRPFGEGRGGAVSTDYRFTGQRDTGLGLYDYNARFYDPALGRFIQADTVVPDLTDGQNYNRFAYVRNNPLKYTDPSGHIAQTEGTTADKYADELLTYGILIPRDWGIFGGVWEAGGWILDDLTIILTVARDLNNLLSGCDMAGTCGSLKDKLGGGVIMTLDPTMGKGGGSLYPIIRLNPKNLRNPDRSLWTVSHELAHALDQFNGGKYSQGLEAWTWGETIDIDSNGDGILDSKQYNYQGTPAKGADKNFTRGEDFAESLTTFLYPEVAKRYINKYFNGPQFVSFHYDNYYLLPRARYILTLINQEMVPQYSILQPR